MTSEPWTSRRLLAWIADAFSRQHIDSPRRCAEELLAHVLGCERLRLYMEADRPATADELTRLRELVARALKHEPLQYLLGEWSFFGMRILTDRRALIPRPCTESIVEHVLQAERRRAADTANTAATRPESPAVLATADQTELPAATSSASAPASASDTPVTSTAPAPLLIADVCTGSGCIAVALAKHLPLARVLATDISADALNLAAANARLHALAEDRLAFLQGHLLQPLAALPGIGGSLDYLVANPPYIPDAEFDAVPENVRLHEPALALRGGPTGLDLIRPIIAGAPALLRPAGTLMIELASSTADAVLAIARATPGLIGARIMTDLESLPRFLLARRADA
ncbi:MAG: N5-glutamine methyltransferase family protein [Phycisphaerales bacterium]